jgi:enterobactin synthetase component D
VAQHSVSFDPEEPGELDTHFPGEPLPESLDRAVRKRQMEFLAGRQCARQAIAACAPDHAGAPIPIGSRREPIWPDAVVGSITHVHRFASAAVARRTDASGIGLDVELVMADALAADVLASIATPDEVAAIARATGWTTARALTVVFSAKETIFKCLHSQVGRYFDFLDAAIDEVDPVAGRFRAHLIATLTPSLAAGHRLEGSFEQDEHRVCTAMVLPP